jgi:hypothetical protein
VDGNCSAISSTVHVSRTTTTINKPIIVSYPSTGRIYGGNTVKLSLQNESMFSSIQYNWYRGDSLITTDTICKTNIAGSYRLLVVDGNCAAWSNIINLTDTACNLPSFVAKNMSMCDSTLFDLVQTIDTMSANTVMKYYTDNLAQIELPSSTVSPHANTTYYLRSLDTVTGCRSSIVPVTITVLSKPALPTAVPNMIYVDGTSVPVYFFTGTTPNASYPWAWMSGDSIIGLPKKGVNTIQGFTATNTDTTVKSATYMYTTDISGGGLVCYAGDTGYFDIVILPKPNVNIANQDQTICSGQVIDTISFTGPVSNTIYTWTRISGTYVGFPVTGVGDLQDSILINKGIMPITLTYQVIPTFTYNGVTSTGASKYFTITINPEPVLSNVPDMEYCQGVVVPAYQFSGSTGLIYSWRKIAGDSVGLRDNGTGALPSFTALNASKTPKTATYEIIASYTSNGITCSVMDTFSITVNPNPVVAAALPARDYCAQDTVSLFDFVTHFAGDNNPQGTEYHWFYVSGNGNVGLGATSGKDTMPSFVTMNTTGQILSIVYGVRAVVGTCSSEVQNFNITVSPTLVLSSTSDAGTICSNDNFTYTATSTVQGVLYSWTRVADTNINGGQTSSGQSQNISEVLINTADTMVRVTYEITLTVNECAKVHQVTVDVSPAIQVSIPYLNDVCIGQPVVEIPYTSSNSAVVYYSITFSTDAQNVGFTSITTPILLPASPITLPLPAGAPSGIYTGIFHFHSGNCTKDSVFAIRVSKPTRILSQPVSQLDLCDGESTITLSVLADGDNLSYQWYRDGIAISGANSDDYYEPFTSDLEGRYHVEVVGNCGTVISDTVEVKTSGLQIQEKWDNVLYIGNTDGLFVRYQWYKNGSALTSGSTFQYYTDKHGFVGTYRVRAYYADGSYVESCSLTLNRSKARKMVLFPNPVRSGEAYKLQLDGENLDNATIEVYDVLGKRLETHVVEGDYIELKAWYAPGSYSIRIITKEEGIRVKKLIVE